MIKPRRNKWTDEQIKNALYMVNGSKNIKFRYDVLRGGVKRTTVNAIGEITLDKDNQIQRTARFTLYEEIDWLLDEIKPYMLLNMGDTAVDNISAANTWDDKDAINLTFIQFDLRNKTWDELDSGVKITWDERDGFDYSFIQWDQLNKTWDELDIGFFNQIKPETQYAEFPLGVFILSTPTRSSTDGLNTWEVEAYDRSIILVEDSLISPLYFASGTSYITAIQSILSGAGIIQVMTLDTVTTTLATDRVFEIGTKKIDIINTLLDEINFNRIYCNADGIFIISAYKEPVADNITWEYFANLLSIIGRDTQSDMDYFNIPNVFIAMCSNPDLNTDYYSIWTNNNAASKFSTISRGRNIVSKIYKPDSITTQTDLDAYVRRIAFEANQVYEPVSFVTALNPLHESREVLLINHPDMAGVFVESGWTFPLSVDGQMNHKVKRLVSI